MLAIVASLIPVNEWRIVGANIRLDEWQALRQPRTAIAVLPQLRDRCAQNLDFVYKMDRVGADFFRVVQMVTDRLGARPAIVQLPIGAEEKFSEIIVLVQMKAVIWEEESLGAKFRVDPIPADLMDQAEEYREKLLETAADCDEALMEKYL